MKLHRWLMRLYPRGSRLRRSGEVARVTDDWLKSSKTGGVWRARWLLVVDVSRTLPLEWIDAVRRFARGGETNDSNGERVLPYAERRRIPMRSWIPGETRQAMRRLLRSPGFTVAAIGTLALGIGANTAVFSVVNAILLEPLPYPESDRLVALEGRRDEDEISISYPDLLDYRERNHTLEAMAGYRGSSFNVTNDGPAERLRGQAVTRELFDVLGVSPERGRVFTEAEAAEPGTRVALIGHGVWQRRFGGSPDAVGRSLRLNGEEFTVIGVMPQGFDFPGGIVYGPAEVWVPLGLQSAQFTDRGSHPGLYAIGRLRDGLSLDAARADLDDIARDLSAEYPATNERTGLRARAALDSLVGSTRPALVALLAGVGLLLLIVCANVANLLLVRTTIRSGETTIRAALGASPVRLMAPAMAESVILATAGGIAGTALGFWMTRAGNAMLGGLPRGGDIPIDMRVLGFSGLMTLVTVLLFGAAPALHALKSRSSAWLRTRNATRATTRLRSGMVVVQIALSVIILIGAGLVVKSFASQLRKDPGIRPDGTLIFTVRLSEAEYTEGDPVRSFYDRLLERIRAMPGVDHAGAISTLPFSGSGSQSGILPAGGTREDLRRTDVNVITPGYLQAMGVDVLEGRGFTDADHAGAVPVVIVDERFARSFFPGETAIGRRVSGWGLENAEIVGVVRHVTNYGVAAESREELYMAHAQRPYYQMRVIVRSEGDPLALVPGLRRIVADLDPALPIDDFRPMNDVVSGTLATPRLTAVLGAGFGSLAALLAAIGIYGVIAYTVSMRTREIGTRVALGAASRSVVRMVVASGMRLALFGVVLGIAGALAATRLLDSQIQDVSRTDPATFALLPLALLGLAAFASWVPAMRASRVSPMEALRTE